MGAEGASKVGVMSRIGHMPRRNYRTNGRPRGATLLYFVACVTRRV